MDRSKQKTKEQSESKSLPATGKPRQEQLQTVNGERTKQYDAAGRVERTVQPKKDGSKETTRFQYGRNGKERSVETLQTGRDGKVFSKTVVVKQTPIILKRTTVTHATIIKHYEPSRFGFVYHPLHPLDTRVFAAWYGPPWFGPAGVWIGHPFHYSWGWDHFAWFPRYRNYWATYNVYPSPSYWVTDWLMAAYVADAYVASVSVAQAREEARIAEEEAERAKFAAQQALGEAEIADAKQAQFAAEQRAVQAEAKLSKAQADEQSGTNPNAVPIDETTKDALRVQIEEAIVEKKSDAEALAKGQATVPRDVSKALMDPKHIYPVSSPISVILAANHAAAGMLTEGDLLQLEAGQDIEANSATQNTFVSMRVLASKGEDGEVKAGTVVSIPIKSLQDFDNEFRAKLDLGIAEALKNRPLFQNDSQNAEANGVIPMAKN